MMDVESRARTVPAERVVLEARGVSKTFGHVIALHELSLALRAGEVTALVGDNGAGKSTLVSLLAGLRQPDTGALYLDGEEVTLDSPSAAQARGIATVFQDLALVPQRDVAANMHLGREPRRWRVFLDRRRMQREATRVIDGLSVNLPSVRALVADLSGGQRQAVAIARAVMRGGRVMLMDEPTAALGVREAAKVAHLIRRLRDTGQGVLLVSHNLPSVFELADRVVCMRLGRIALDAPIAQTSQEEVVAMMVGARSAA